MSTAAIVEALLTPGGSTQPSFAYLPGVRSGATRGKLGHSLLLANQRLIGAAENVTNCGDDGIRASSVTNLTIVGNSGKGLAPAITGNCDNNLALTNDAATLTDFAAVDAVQNDGKAVMNITMESTVITEPGTTIDYAYGLAS